jgi:hypothetical protein
MQLAIDTKTKSKVDVSKLNEFLIGAFTNDELKKLTTQLTGPTRLTKKADLAQSLAQAFAGALLKRTYSKLTPIEQKAISEGLHSKEGYSETQFKAKYGKTPTFGESSGYHSRPENIRLFLQYEGSGCYRVPKCLREALLELVEKPQDPTITGIAELPEFFEYNSKSYEWDEDDPGRTIAFRNALYISPTKAPTCTVNSEQIKINCEEREEKAQSELWLILRALKEGKISVAEKSGQPSSDTMWKISRLLGLDFYQTIDGDEYKKIGLIRSFAWPMLLQSAGLAKTCGKKLGIAKSALDALSQKPHEMIAQMWKNWLQSDFFDEFRRIDCIKGQTGKAQRWMTKPSTRKKSIEIALRKCPAGSWITIEEFSRFLLASGYAFDITSNPGSLYLQSPNYGAMYYGGSKWEYMQERYIRCFLFEYAAALGIVDVAFIDPEYGSDDYTEMWGTDDLPFFSRYDGLLYFRINALGEYCLGKTRSYSGAKKKRELKVSIMSNLRITVAEGELPISDEITLDSFAERLAEGSWELSKEKSISACENGQSIRVIRQLLESLDDQELPDKVESFLSRIEKNATALQSEGEALLFFCFDAKVAAELKSHSLTKSICLIAEPNHIIVKKSNVEKFRKAIRVIGYGCAEISA